MTQSPSRSTSSPLGTRTLSLRLTMRMMVWREISRSMILGAEAVKDDTHVDLKEVVLGRHSPWNGMRIMDLDISRQTIILMVKRKENVLVPKGELVLLEGDCVILYSQERVHGANTIHL